MRHDLIKTGDADSFKQIQDRNGEVALAYCRRCRKGEGELGPECEALTADTITDEQIRELRDGEIGIADPRARDVARIALQHGTPIGKHPMCNACGWRKGGVDCWDNDRCKCGNWEPALYRCSSCNGLGTVPYDIGSQPCTSCDGSGLFSPNQVGAARARAAELLNARAKEAS